MTVKRSEVRSFRLRKEVDEKFLEIHKTFQDEYVKRLEAAGITADRSWSFTDTFERMIHDTLDVFTHEKSPQSVD